MIVRKRIETDSIQNYLVCDKFSDFYLIANLNKTESEMNIGRYDFHKNYKILAGFDKSNRSSFSYWFAHWCAFQLTALNLRRWKFKYLFHDFEKPWMKLFCKYKTV